MDLRILALALVTCYLLYRYLRKKLDYFKDLDIPHIPPSIILGNMTDAVLQRRHMVHIVRDIYNLSSEAKYVGAFEFMRPVVVLRDLDLIKSVAIKNFDSFMDHKPFMSEGIDQFFSQNLFNLTGERWRESRNLISPSFTSSKLKGMFGLMNKVAENFADYLALQAKDPGNMLCMKDLFTRYTNDLIATCAFGINVDSLKDPNNEFYQMGRKATYLGGIRTFKFFISRAFPGLLKRLNIKFMSDDMMRYYIDIVSTTIKMREEKGISRPDMLQLMMEARENKKLELNIVEMAAHAFSFFFGGFDTSSTQMCLVAHELAVNPDIQKRLQDEIDKILNESNGKPTYESILGMSYLDAVFNESLRYHSQGPFLDRVCTRAFELPPALPGGRKIVLEPGSSVWFPVAGIHMDPNYYENPEKFDPDRYYEKKASINDALTLGFGIGPRSCIGYRFATLEVKIVIFHILAKFNLKPNKKTCIPLEYSLNGFSLEAKGGFWLSVEPRSDIVY